jgi:signal peptidase I
MPETAPNDLRERSPFLTIWWRPRETIQHVAAGTSGSMVLLLAAVGGAASGVDYLLTLGGYQALADWRVLLTGIGVGSALIIVNLYVTAWIAGGIGRLIGGSASTAAVRAAFAWGMLPVIAGAVLAVAVAVGQRAVDIGPASSRVLTLISALASLWSFVMAVLMLGRLERFGILRSIVTYSIAALFAPAMLALLVRTFVAQPFSISSNSGSPTLLRGDQIFATKYAYGYSRYSLPFGIASFEGRVFASEPQRGDWVVFRLPKDTRTDYVKRVIGLPGDRIQMISGELVINGTPVKRQRIADFTGSDACGSGKGAVRRWRETLPNDVSYETLDCVDNGFYDNTPVYTVPEGHFFAMGDNRDNSTDSRVMSAMGFIPFDNLVGRMSMIFFSRADKEDGGAPRIRTGRIGMMVQ